MTFKMMMIATMGILSMAATAEAKDGLPTGKRMHKPFKMISAAAKAGPLAGISAAQLAQRAPSCKGGKCIATHSGGPDMKIVSPRDLASGMPTGKSLNPGKGHVVGSSGNGKAVVARVKVKVPSLTARTVINKSKSNVKNN